MRPRLAPLVFYFSLLSLRDACGTIIDQLMYSWLDAIRIYRRFFYFNLLSSRDACGIIAVNLIDSGSPRDACESIGCFRATRAAQLLLI